MALIHINSLLTGLPQYWGMKAPSTHATPNFTLFIYYLGKDSVAIYLYRISSDYYYAIVTRQSVDINVHLCPCVLQQVLVIYMTIHKRQCRNML